MGKFASVTRPLSDFLCWAWGRGYVVVHYPFSHVSPDWKKWYTSVGLLADTWSPLNCCFCFLYLSSNSVTLCLCIPLSTCFLQYYLYPCYCITLIRCLVFVYYVHRESTHLGLPFVQPLSIGKLFKFQLTQPAIHADQFLLWCCNVIILVIKLHYVTAVDLHLCMQ